MNSSVRFYLLGYNALAFLLWLCYALSFAFTHSAISLPSVLLLAAAQSIAILELLHAALHWVKTPILSGAVQIASRLLVMTLIVVGYVTYVPPKVFLVGLVFISVAWTLTELVRYAHYFLQLASAPRRELQWLRYSLFIVLYPIGVLGEWLIIGAFLIHLGIGWNLHTFLGILLFLIYAFYFPKLYGYMWQQRRKHLA